MAHGPARRRGRFRTSQGGKGAIKSTLHRSPVGQGPPGPDWLAISLGFWSRWPLATGTAWAGLCLIHHHHQGGYKEHKKTTEHRANCARTTTAVPNAGCCGHSPPKAKGPWEHHHRNRHRCRFRRRQRWSAAVRRSSAPASCARLLCAQTFPGRLAALESEAAGETVVCI